MDGQLTHNIIPTVLDAPLQLSVTPGMTLLEIMRASDIDEAHYGYIVLILNGHVVRDWAHVMTLDGDTLEIAVVPAGGDTGKQVFSAIAMIAISVAAPYAALAILGSAAQGTMAFYAVAAGLTLVGNLAISALISPSQQYTSGTRDRTQASENPAYKFTGQSNEARPYGTVPRLYGRNRFYPLLASTPLITNVGKRSRMVALYDFGIGSVDVSNLKIGNLAASTLDPDVVAHKNTLGDNLKLVTKSPSYTEFELTLLKNQPQTVTTHDESRSATLDLYFPQGLAALKANGDRYLHSAAFRVEYRKAGSADAWAQVPSSDFLGVNTNEQSWIWDAEYSRVDDVRTYWAVLDRTGEYRKYSKLSLLRNAGVLYANENDDHDDDWSYDTVTEFTTNKRPYRRGVARDTEPNYGGDTSATRTYFELLVPSAPPANSVTISAATLVPFTASVRIVFAEPGVYDIRSTRLTDVSMGEESEKSLVDVGVLTMLKSFKGGAVVNLKHRHTLQELAFEASDSANASIDSLNAITQSWVRTVTFDGFGELVMTSNNALIALDIAAGPAAVRPLKAAQIDFPSWNKLKLRCNEQVTTVVNGITYITKRHEWNGVIDTDMTTKDAIDAVLSVARAGRCITPEGKFGVLLDIPQDGYRQLITPENSWGFEANRLFSRLPDGLRVSFIDAEADYMPREVIAYRDGKNAFNAEVIEDLQTCGITSMAQAWRHGRYMLAQGIMRSETFTVNMDVENLAVGRGDLVAVQHDVPLLGGQAMRVVSVNGDTVTVTRPIELGAGSYTVRLNNGTIRQGRVLGQIDTDTFTFDDTTGMAADNLLALGDSNPVTRPYIVQSIEAGEDLTAKLQLVMYNEGVYTADEGDIPDWDPGFGDAVNQTTDVRVSVPQLSYKWVFADGIPYAEVLIKWAPIRAAYAYIGADVLLKTGQLTTQIGEVTKAGTGQLTYRIRYDAAGQFGVPLTFIVRPQSMSGMQGQTSQKSITLQSYVSTPQPPTDFGLDTRGGALTLSWIPSPSLDIASYVIRYTPDTVNPTWATSQYLASVNFKQTSATVPPRPGVYMIKAVNVIGTQSTMLKLTLPIADLPDLKLLEALDDAPLWSGALDGFSKGSGGGQPGAKVLLLDKVTTVMATMAGVSSYLVKKLDGSYVDVGLGGAIPSSYLVSTVPWTSDTTQRATYTSAVTTDLGDVFELHMQAGMLVGVVDAGIAGTMQLSAGPQGHGITPYIDAPVTYADTTDFDVGWTVWLEYRTKGAAGDVYSDWRKIVSGMTTGRYFQFRIVAAASAGSTQVVIYTGKITLSMAGRLWVSDVLTVPITGLQINFVPAFYAPPAISVSAEDVASVNVTNLTRSSATIFLLNKSGQEVVGDAYVVASGYGTQRGAAI